MNAVNKNAFILFLRLILLVAVLGILAIWLGMSPQFVALTAGVLIAVPLILLGPVPFMPLLFAAIIGGAVFIWYLTAAFSGI